MTTKTTECDLFSLFNLSTVDVIEQINVLLDQEESLHYQMRDYLRVSSCTHNAAGKQCSSGSRLCAESRSKVARWLAEIVDYFSLQRQTVAVAMSYVDRFLSLRTQEASEARRSHTKFQLVALVCLSIATKNLEVTHLDVETLVNASQGCYCADDIRDMEGLVLNSLDWRLSGPTTLPIAHRATAILTKVVPRLTNGTREHSNHCKTLISCLVEFTRLQLELAVSDYSSSVLRSPSTVALASILNSMELLDFDNNERKIFRRAMADMTGLDLHSIDIADARDELNEVFDRQSESVMSRADVVSSTVNMRSSSSDSTTASSVATSITSWSSHSRLSQVGVDEPIQTVSAQTRRRLSSRKNGGGKEASRRNSKHYYKDDESADDYIEIPRAVELFRGFGRSKF